MSAEYFNLLDPYHNNALGQMAEAAGLDIRPNGKKLNKGELMLLMEREYFTGQRIRASLEKLKETERAVLNQLLLRGGRIASRTFQRELLRAKLVTPTPTVKAKSQPYYGEPTYEGDPHRRSNVFEDVIARLTYHGLVFSTGSTSSYGGPVAKLQFSPGTTLLVPGFVRAFLPDPESVPARQAWQPGHTRQGDPSLLRRDLYLYWDFVRRNQVPLIQGGLVGKRSLKAINETLLVADPSLDRAKKENDTGRLFLLRLMLEQLKLVQSSPNELRPASKDPSAIPSFWQQPAAAQVRSLIEIWSLLPHLTEMDQEALIYYPQTAVGRRLLVQMLREVPAGVWLERDELLERIRNRDLNFLFTFHSDAEGRGGSGSYYYYRNVSYYGRPDELLKKLEIWEEHFVARCLAGFLFQAGIVELAYEQADHSADDWLALRLTPLGLAVLGIALEPEQATTTADTGRVVIQPNFQVLAIGPVELSVLARLDTLGQRLRTDPAVFEYQLTRDASYAALQGGLTAAQLIAELERLSDTEIPQNVRRSIEEWGAHHERIVFRTGMTLLQAADAALLDQLQAGNHTGKLLSRPLTTDVALVKKGRQKAIVAAMLEEGILPAVSGANPQSADRSVTIQVDGLVQPVHAVPSLHLRGRLARYVEEKDGAGWQITPHSIKQAGGSKNKVRAILDDLGRLNRGELPAPLVEQIKNWGGYYGQAAAETVTLIEFHDRETLAELLAHPQLKPHLKPFPAEGRALAIVADGQLKTVRRILENLGVPVKDKL